MAGCGVVQSDVADLNALFGVQVKQVVGLGEFDSTWELVHTHKAADDAIGIVD